MKKGNDLGHDPILKLVLKLTIPAMLAQLINVLYSIIDRMFIGHIPEVGDVALAGVGVCGPIVTLISSFATLVGIGGSIMMAISMGRGDHTQARIILSNSFLLLLGFSAVLTTVFLLTKRQMIYLFGGSDTTFPYANTYLTIYTLGTFFAVLALGLNYFINCQGFSLNGMLTVLLGAVSNIVLDTIFVPILGWGVAGAALATVISQMLSCLYALIFLFSKRPPIRITFGHYDRRLMAKILTMGISPFIILSTDSLIIIAMNMVLQKFGGADGDMLISAATIMQSYFLMITGPLIGISGGVQPLISFNFGACSEPRVRQTIRCALIMGIVFTGTMCLISQLFCGSFARFFTDHAETAAQAARGIRIFTVAVVCLAFQYVLVDALTALGRIRSALYLSASRKISFLVFTVLFAAIFSARAAFYAEPVADLLGATQSTVVFLAVYKPHMLRSLGPAAPSNEDD